MQCTTYIDSEAGLPSAAALVTVGGEPQDEALPLLKHWNACAPGTKSTPVACKHVRTFASTFSFKDGSTAAMSVMSTAFAPRLNTTRPTMPAHASGVSLTLML